MGILTEEDKNEIRDWLTEIMGKIEQTLNGTYVPSFDQDVKADFYVTTQYIGFTNYYCARGNNHYATSTLTTTFAELK